jgi:hypothetical protein
MSALQVQERGVSTGGGLFSLESLPRVGAIKNKTIYLKKTN